MRILSKKVKKDEAGWISNGEEKEKHAWHRVEK